MRVQSIQLPFGAGQRVYDKTDPRHIGRVEAIHNTLIAKVRWENGWVSEMHVRHLARGETAEHAAVWGQA